MKETINILIILAGILCYIIPTVFNYLWLKKAFSPEGKWSKLKMNGEAWFFILVPIFNTAAALSNLFNTPYARK